MLNATDRQAVSKLFISCSARECLDSTTRRCDHMPARRYSNDCMNVATHAVIYKMKFLFLHSAAEKHPPANFFKKLSTASLHLLCEHFYGAQVASQLNQYERKNSGKCNEILSLVKHLKRYFMRIFSVCAL